MIDIFKLLEKAESDEEVNRIYNMNFNQFTRHILENMDYDEPLDPDNPDETEY